MSTTAESNAAGNQGSNPHQTFRVRLAIRGLSTTAVRSDQNYSDWVLAAVNVVEVRDTSPGRVVGSRWGIGICVAPPQETVIIDLMSEEWTFDYLESYKMIAFQRTFPDGTYIRQCILVPDRSAFLILSSVCASIKMYTYYGAMPY